VLVLGVLLLPSCGMSSGMTGSVDYPNEPRPDWIKPSLPGGLPVRTLPHPDIVSQFGRPDAKVAGVRAAVAADDFHGSKLYDGFDLEVQPLGPDGKPVKKLGHLSVILYEFVANTRSGKGRELMRWYVPASDMVNLWTIAFAGGSYRMKLMWNARPRTDFVKMEVHFTTLDGLTFTELKTPDTVDQPRYRWLRK